MASRHTPMIATAGALLLALTACGGNRDASPTTPATTEPHSTTAPAPTDAETPSETPSPTPSAAAVPAPDPADYPGMDQQTEDGAEAFYRFFWDSYVYAKITGDPSILQSISGASCGWCAEIVTKAQSQGPAWESGMINITDIAVDLSMDPPAVFAKFDATAQERASSTESSPSSKASQMIAGSELTWTGSGWLVNSMNVDEL